MTSTPDTPATPDPSTPSAGQRPRSRKRWWLALGGGIILLLALVLLLLPTLLSTRMGAALLESQINKNIPGRVTLGGLSLGWFSGQRVTNVVVTEPGGGKVVEVGTVELPDYSLLAAVTGSRALGTIRIAQPVVRVEQYADGSTSLSRALQASASTPAVKSGMGNTPVSSAPAGKIPAGLQAKVEWQDGQVQFITPETRSQLTDLRGTAEYSDATGELALHAQGQIQGAGQPGSIKVSGKVSQPAKAPGAWQPELAQVDLRAEVTNFPLALAEGYAGGAGPARRWSALLGPTLTAQVDIKGGMKQFTLTTTGNTAQAQLKLTMAMAQEGTGGTRIFTIAPDSLLTWNIPLEGGAGEGRASAPRSAAVSVAFEQVKLAMSPSGKMTADSRAAARVTVGDFQLDLGRELGWIALSGTNAELKLEGGETLTAALAMQSLARYRNQEGKILVQAALRDFLDAQGQWRPAGMTGQVDAQLLNWPVGVVDELARTGRLLTEAIGPTLSANLQAQLALSAPGQTAAGNFNLSLMSDHLRGSIAGQMNREGLTVPSGQAISLRLTPALAAQALAQFTPADSRFRAARLHSPVDVTWTLDRLTLPWGSDLSQLDVKTSIASTPAIMEDLPGLKQVILDQPRLEVDYNAQEKRLAAGWQARIVQPLGVSPLNFSVDLFHLVDDQGRLTWNQAQGHVSLAVNDIPAQLVDVSWNYPGLGLAALGETVSLALGAEVSPNRAAKLPHIAGNLEVSAANLQLALTGRCDGKTWQISQTAPISYRLDPKVLTVLKQNRPALAEKLQTLEIAAAPTLRLDGLKLQAPLGDTMDWQAARINGQLTLDVLVLKNHARWEDVGISNFIFKLVEDSTLANMQADVSCQIRHGTQAGKLTASLKLGDLLAGGTPSFKCPARVDNLPMSLLDQITGQPGLFTAVVGEVVQRLDLVDLSNTPQDRTDYGFTCVLQAPNLQASLKGRFQPGVLAELQPGGKIALTLTPASVAALRSRWLQAQGAAAQVAWTQDATLEITLQECRLGLPRGGASEGAGLIDPARSAVRLSMTATPLTIADAGRKETLQVSRLAAELNAPDLRREVTVTAQSEYQTTGGAEKLAGKLSSNTRIQGLLDDAGRFDARRLQFDTASSLSGLPVGILDDLFNRQGQWIGLLGAQADAVLRGQYAPGQGGPLDLQVRSPLFNLNIPAVLDGEMTLTLRENGAATFMLTPELAQQYLAKANFLLKEAQSSREPIRLTLLREQVRLPLKDLGAHLEKAQLAGHLELGTLRVRRGPGGEIVGLLRAFGARIQDREVFDAAFSPMDFTLKDGVVTCSDLWMDTGDLRLGSQSRVYLTGKPQTPWAEVLLAIPGETVLIVPGTRGRIDPRNIYTVGTVGPLAQIKPDLGKMLTELIAPITGQAIGGDVGTAIGIGAAILGGLDKNKNKDPGAQAAWFAQAQWPHRPAPVVPATAPEVAPAPTQTPAQPGAQPQQPPAEKKPEPKPEEQIIKGLLDALAKPKPKQQPQPKQ